MMSCRSPVTCLYVIEVSSFQEVAVLKMAQRLMLRQFISSFGRSLTGPAQVFPNTLSQCSKTYGLLSTTSSKPVLTTARKINVSHSCRVTFNVQNKEDFQDRVIGCETPVIVDFHAQWCGPCKILGTRLEKAVAKQQGKVLMAKVDIDDHTDLALEYESKNKGKVAGKASIARWIRLTIEMCYKLSNLDPPGQMKTLLHSIDSTLLLLVCAVPTVLAMKNGTIIDQFVGIKEDDELEAFLKKLIGP